MSDWKEKKEEYSMEFNYNIVKNPQIFSQQELPYHSDHKFYAQEEELEQKQSRFVKSLNGVWKFSYAVNYEARIRDFESMHIDCHDWEEIRVPAHIQMEGYDSPQYINVQYPWEGREEIEPGEIPTHFNPVASYVKYFYAPKDWKRIFISFEGVESAMAVWLNGFYIGYAEDSFATHDFELTKYVREGENKLAVQVFKFCAGSFCESQDFYRFSGIYRNVFLYTIPKTHIWDLKIETKLNQIREIEAEAAEIVLNIKIFGNGSINAEVLRERKRVTKTQRIFAGENEIRIPMKRVKLWSAEYPNLYTIRLKVYDELGKNMEIIEEKIGFRQFEIKNCLMLINGKRIVFNGVNRQEFSSISGRNMTEEEMRLDIRTMKQNNINALRTSHYPNQRLLYDLCDEYGIYLMAETNLESHGSWDPVFRGFKERETIVPGDREEWLALTIARADSNYQKNKNHPSILIWSCGNESYGGYNIYREARYFRSVDSSRLVHYEGIFQDRRYENTSDMESQMYPSAEQIEEFLKVHRDKPFICCEYLHAMGNSCGAMHKYIDLTESEPLYQGGFIWDYIDQVIEKKNRYGELFQAYGGDFGERATNYNFSGNGIVYGDDRKPSPKMQEVKFHYQGIVVKVGKLKAEIINKNLFTNTEEYDCIVRLEKEGRLICSEKMETAVAPLSRKKYILPIKPCETAGEYCITVSFRLKEDMIWAKRGHEVAFGQYIYKNEGRVAEKDRYKNLTVQKSSVYAGVYGENFSVLFSLLKGGLVSYKYAGRELLESMPRPNFWRAPTDNELGSDMPFETGQWKLASQYLKPVDQEILIEQYKEFVEVKFSYELPIGKENFCSLTYQIYRDGEVKIHLSYHGIENASCMPEFGVLFKMSADYDQLLWYGYGPEETYIDRYQGGKLGIYKNTVAENMAKYLNPQECGNKVGVRYAKVTDKLGRGMLIFGENLSLNVLPYTPYEVENASHFHELPPVHYTVVRVAKQQMGIGGDDSWGARVHKEYLIDSTKEMSFTFRIKGI